MGAHFPYDGDGIGDFDALSIDIINCKQKNLQENLLRVLFCLQRMNIQRLSLFLSRLNNTFMKRITFLLLAIIGLASCNDTLDVTITNPNVEQQFHEQALATAQPRFSWQYETTESEVVQQNYHIIVATTAKNAQKSIGDLWDSGVVPSNQMLYIPYGGKELKSRDKAYWRVITTVTAKGSKKAKIESEVKSFEISLLNQIGRAHV